MYERCECVKYGIMSSGPVYYVKIVYCMKDSSFGQLVIIIFVLVHPV